MPITPPSSGPDLGEVHHLILDAERCEKEFERTLSGLIADSHLVVLLTPRRATQIASLEALRQRLPKWPSWRTSRPWILAGRKRARSADSAPPYSGPFIEDCQSSDAYHQQVTKLLAQFDWALFSYFTTYHDNLVTLITTQKEWVRASDNSPLLIHHQCGPLPLLQRLPNASYYDGGKEGLYAYQLACTQQQIPLLLVQINEDDPEYYWTYDHETECVQEECWYAAPLARLELYREFTVRRPPYGQHEHYRLYRVTDFGAYVDLWARSSDENSIAIATLAADCDVTALERALRRQYGLNLIREGDAIASWAYQLIYGGGAAEHHALFHSRDPSLTHYIWQAAGQGMISRF